MKLLKVESDKRWSAINGVPVRFHRLHLREHVSEIRVNQIFTIPTGRYNATPYGGIETSHLMHMGADATRDGECWEIVVTLRESPLVSYAETVKVLVDGEAKDTDQCPYTPDEFRDSLPTCPAFEPAESMPYMEPFDPLGVLS